MVLCGLNSASMIEMEKSEKNIDVCLIGLFSFIKW